MTASTGPDPTPAMTLASGKLTATCSTSSMSPTGGPALEWTGEATRSWSYLALSGACAILVPPTVLAVAQLTDDGPVRLLLTWPIALLMGSAVYAWAAATNTARRLVGGEDGRPQPPGQRQPRRAVSSAAAPPDGG